MTEPVGDPTPDSPQLRVLRLGATAALLAAVFFRRNIAAELSLLGLPTAPANVADWFALLHANRLLGLAYLNAFDLVNYALVGVMFFALCVALGRKAVPAGILAAAGIGVYFASNTALLMLQLSERYSLVTDAVQRSALLAAGTMALAANRFTNPGAHPGAGGYLSLLLVAAAGVGMSIAMLRDDAPWRATDWLGLLAGGLDIAYCITYLFARPGSTQAVALIFIPAAGLFWMLWHLCVAWRLYRISGLNRPTSVST